MPSSRVFVAIALAIVMAGGAAAQQGGKGGGRPAIPAPVKITIPSFPDGGSIPVKYANSAQGSTSPAMEWSNVPADTVSFALILHDGDVAPAGGPDDTLHWMIFNIPGAAKGLPEGVPHNLTLEDGSVQLKYVDGVPRVAIGTVGYFGPNPPPNQPPTPHHYVFDLYALDVKLDPALNSRQALMNAMTGHVLAKGVYFGVYTNPVPAR